MDEFYILKRLVSIKGNALARASYELAEHPGCEHEMKAFILENGIQQLIIEIQNAVMADRIANSALIYKRSASSQAN